MDYFLYFTGLKPSKSLIPTKTPPELYIPSTSNNINKKELFLEKVISRGDIGRLDKYLNQIENIYDLYNSDKTNPVYIAIKLNKPDILDFLIKRGELPQEYKDRAYTYVLRSGNIEMFDILAINGLMPTINTIEKFILPYMVLKNVAYNTLILRKLVEMGVDINVQLPNGKYLIDKTIDRSNWYILLALIYAGADISKVNFKRILKIYINEEKPEIPIDLVHALLQPYNNLTREEIYQNNFSLRVMYSYLSWYRNDKKYMIDFVNGASDLIKIGFLEYVLSSMVFVKDTVDLVKIIVNYGNIDINSQTVLHPNRISLLEYAYDLQRKWGHKFTPILDILIGNASNELQYKPIPAPGHESENGEYVNEMMYDPIEQNNIMVDFVMNPGNLANPRYAYNMGKYYKKSHINAFHAQAGRERHPIIQGANIGPMRYYKANIGKPIAAPIAAANTRRRNDNVNNQEGGKRRRRRHTRKSHRKHKKN